MGVEMVERSRSTNATKSSTANGVAAFTGMMIEDYNLRTKVALRPGEANTRVMVGVESDSSS